MTNQYEFDISQAKMARRGPKDVYRIDKRPKFQYDINLYPSMHDIKKKFWLLLVTAISIYFIQYSFKLTCDPSWEAIWFYKQNKHLVVATHIRVYEQVYVFLFIGERFKRQTMSYVMSLLIDDQTIIYIPPFQYSDSILNTFDAWTFIVHHLHLWTVHARQNILPMPSFSPFFVAATKGCSFFSISNPLSWQRSLLVTILKNYGFSELKGASHCMQASIFEWLFCFSFYIIPLYFND